MEWAEKRKNASKFELFRAEKAFSLSSSSIPHRFLLLAGDSLLELFNAADVDVVSCQIVMEEIERDRGRRMK